MLIYIQGGPGNSSQMANLFEMGPLKYDEKNNNNSWLKHVSLLFLDFPIGTGLSQIDSNYYITEDNLSIYSQFINTLKNLF